MPGKTLINRDWIARIGCFLLAGVILGGGGLLLGMRQNAVEKNAPFDGERAYRDVTAQVSFGPRIPGSPAHEKTITYIEESLQAAGWQVSEQRFFNGNRWNTNLRASRDSNPPRVIIGAHYDSRKIADHDPTPANRLSPVPGANDGASGVGVLLEMGRVLPPELARQTGLVFFDAEDNGGSAGQEWIAGSRAFVDALTEKPEAVVILDMIGDRDLTLYQEMNSDPVLTSQIWKKAADLGYEKIFIQQPKYRLLDDHVPFIQAGIPAVDIIDFDYPAWHTLADTVDQVSPSSLQVVGEVVLTWLDDFMAGRSPDA